MSSPSSISVQDVHQKVGAVEPHKQSGGMSYTEKVQIPFFQRLVVMCTNKEGSVKTLKLHVLSEPEIKEGVYFSCWCSVWIPAMGHS